MAAYPLIGVSGSIDAEETRHFILRDYLTAVIVAGGVPVLLSPDMEGDMLEDCLARLDGLLMAGGNDVSPALFGEPPVEALGEVNPLRDGFEMRLVRLAAARCMPVLGICRGVQAMAAALGGSPQPVPYGGWKPAHRAPADITGALCQPYRVRSPRYAAGAPHSRRGNAMRQFLPSSGGEGAGQPARVRPCPGRRDRGHRG